MWKKQKIESNRDKEHFERPKDTTSVNDGDNREETTAPVQQVEAESEDQTSIKSEEPTTPPAAPREAKQQSLDVILSGVDELSLVPNDHTAA